jgi:hypothetical protein
MRPRPLSRQTRPLPIQLSLLLPAPRLATLAPEVRAGVIAVLARLLLEAARPAPEGVDDAS